MVMITTRISARADPNYAFEDQVLYYADREAARPIPSAWQVADAQLAEHLGIAPGTVVDRETYLALFRGEHPQTGEILTQNVGKSDRIAAYDHTFSPGKGVSLLWAYGSPEVRARIEAMHGAAVRHALQYLDDHSYTRTGKNGINVVKASVVRAIFTHRDARPVEILTADRDLDHLMLPRSTTGKPMVVAPQLHSHVLEPAVAWRRGPDGKWLSSALDSNQVMERQRAAGNLYSAHLMAALREEFPGLVLEVDGQGNFDVASIDEADRRNFSPRRAKIETGLAALAREAGQSIAARAEITRAINLATREAKLASAEFDLDEHFGELSRLMAFGREEVERVVAEAAERDPQVFKEVDLTGVAETLLASRAFVRRSNVFTEVSRRFVEAGGTQDYHLINRAVDQVIERQFIEAPERDQFGRTILTHSSVLSAELGVLESSRVLAGDQAPALDEAQAMAVVEAAERDAAVKYRSNQPSPAMFSELERIASRRALSGRMLGTRDLMAVLARCDRVRQLDRRRGLGVEERATRSEERAAVVNEIRVMAQEIVSQAEAERGDLSDPDVAGQLIAQAATRRNFHFGLGALTAAQRLFIHRALKSGRMVLLEGGAGTGKTTTIVPVARHFERLGKQVIGTSLEWRATNALAKEAGISGEAVAAFVARHRRDPAALDWDENTVLLIDEFGKIDAKLLNQLLDIAREKNVHKIVGIGDRRQLRAIGIGAFDLAMEHADGQVRLSETTRQRFQIDRDIATLVSQCRAADALALMRQDKKRPRIFLERQSETASGAENCLGRAVQLYRDYVSDPRNRERGFTEALIIAHTNAEVRALNGRLRDFHRERGEITGPDVRVMVRAPKGGDFDEHEIDLARGDKIRFFRRNDKLGVFNGTTATINAIEVDRSGGQDHRLTVTIHDAQKGIDRETSFKLSDLADRFADKNNRIPLLAHFYASSLTMSQGATVNGLVIGSHSLGVSGVDSHAAYVELSRARDRTVLVANAEAIQIHLWAGEAREHGVRPREATDDELVAAIAEEFSRDPPAINAAYYFQKSERGQKPNYLAAAEKMQAAMAAHAEILERAADGREVYDLKPTPTPTQKAPTPQARAEPNGVNHVGSLAVLAGVPAYDEGPLSAKIVGVKTELGCEGPRREAVKLTKKIDQNPPALRVLSGALDIETAQRLSAERRPWEALRHLETLFAVADGHGPSALRAGRVGRALTNLGRTMLSASRLALTTDERERARRAADGRFKIMERAERVARALDLLDEIDAGGSVPGWRRLTRPIALWAARRHAAKLAPVELVHLADARPDVLTRRDPEITGFFSVEQKKHFDAIRRQTGEDRDRLVARIDHAYQRGPASASAVAVALAAAISARETPNWDTTAELRRRADPSLLEALARNRGMNGLSADVERVLTVIDHLAEKRTDETARALRRDFADLSAQNPALAVALKECLTRGGERLDRVLEAGSTPSRPAPGPRL